MNSTSAGEIWIQLTGPILFGVAFAVGSVFRFDGQAAILTLPIVLFGWVSCLSAAVLGVVEARSASWRVGFAFGALVNASPILYILMAGGPRHR